MSTKVIEKILMDNNGQLQDGVQIAMQEDIISDQKEWSEDDAAKNIDFTSNDYWLVTDTGEKPKGFDTDDELKELVPENEHFQSNGMEM